MTDDDRTPSPRRRPSFGLPGSEGTPHAASAPRHEDQTGPHAATRDAHPTTAASSGPGATAVGTAPRRGTRQILLGLAALVLAAIAMAAGAGLGLKAAYDGVTEQPTPFNGTTTTIDAHEGDLYVLYAPDEAMVCSETTSTPDALSTTSLAGNVRTGPKGETYIERMGLYVGSDTSLTITCEGPGAGYVGPIHLFSAVIPFLIGTLLALVLTVTGLALLIAGIVRRLSRPRA